MHSAIWPAIIDPCHRKTCQLGTRNVEELKKDIAMAGHGQLTKDSTTSFHSKPFSSSLVPIKTYCSSMSNWGMNSYLYSPKDDAKHS